MSPRDERLLGGLRAARDDARDRRQLSAAHANLARFLAALGERDEALDVLRRAMNLAPGRPEDFEAVAFAAFGLNEHQLARDAYQAVVRGAPGDALARYNLASSERNIGHFSEAERACEEALARDPTLFQAALLRAQVLTQRPERNHVESLRADLHRYADLPKAQIFLNYALGKELEDLGAYDEAFAHFRQGAQARRRSLEYDVSRDLGILKRIAEVYDAPVLGGSQVPTTSPTHGFVLGLPRSGTTLIERVLTGHPGVRSNGETDNFSTALLRVLPEGEGDIFERAARAPAAQVASSYRQLAGRPPVGGLVTEKLPLNYLYVGAIKLALPEAPVIVVRRDPIDNCLAMYTTLFGAAYPFSYDLEELARYHAGYARLMMHWKNALDDRLLEISYEAFVHRPQEIGPDIARYAGLDWRAEALKVEENAAGSATASAVQVRRPIYSTAAGRWRNYANHLGPLVDALLAQGIGR